MFLLLQIVVILAVLPLGVYCHEGTRFAFALPPISFGRAVDTEIILTSREQASATITFPDLTTQHVEIPDGGASVSLVVDDAWRVNNSLETKGFYIDSTIPIAVHMAAAKFTRSVQPEASLLRPITDASKEFLFASHNRSRVDAGEKPYSFYMIVASEPNTRVKVYNTDDGHQVLDLDTTLFEHEVYTRDAYYEPDGEFVDYTGDYIVADKPVSVMSGHGVAANDVTHRYVMDYIPPIATLGTDYTTFPTEHGNEIYGYRVKVIAAENDTSVSVPSLGYDESLNFGDVFDFEFSDLRSAVNIHCSSPCMTVQYINVARDSGTTTRRLGAFMIVLVPDTQFVDDVVFQTPRFLVAENTSVAALSIITDYEPLEGPYLNEADLSNLEWRSTSDGMRYFATLELSGYDFYSLSSGHQSNRLVAYMYVQNPGEASAVFSMGLTTGYGLEDAPDPEEERTPPLYQTILLGNFTSANEENFTSQCSEALGINFRNKATVMIPDLQAKLGQELCSDLDNDDVQVTSLLAFLKTSENMGGTELIYYLRASNYITFADFTGCATELNTYLQDFDIWGYPIIPSVPDCPEPMFDPDHFFDGATGNDWICLTSGDADSVYLVDVPRYSLHLYDNFTTYDGSELDVDCTQRYGMDFAMQAMAMVDTVNAQITSGNVCPGHNGRISVASTVTALVSQGDWGILTASFLIDPLDEALRFVDVYACVDDIFLFLREHNHWGDLPLLPQLPGCPLLNFATTYFYHDGDIWICPSSI